MDDRASLQPKKVQKQSKSLYFRITLYPPNDVLHVEQAEIDGKTEKSVWLSPQTDKRVHS